MIIPPRLEALLLKDQGIAGKTQKTLAVFGPWVEQNRVRFFDEYTKHDRSHIEAVLRGMEALIPSDAWGHLTPKDSAVCVMSALLHDLAMHLSEDGFLALIGGRWPIHTRSMFLNIDADWPQLWGDFLIEAKRFDDKKKMELFGTLDGVSSIPEDRQHWNDLHRFLIGEFLRKHHATLAHAIALNGLPGPGDILLSLDEFEESERDLIGFVARSHNLGLRLCIDNLPRNQKRFYRQVHTPYIMALLRIGDYLEIDAVRAPREVLQVRSLSSLISQQEWRNHAAVHDVTLYENDPECLWVDAEPLDVKTFLDLKRLLVSIQNELDSTWAALGEVYNSDKDLRCLGLQVRRLRSTIDDEINFAETAKYIPVHANFHTADAEVLKLLVGPVYDNEPNYGIRELMQNAVDACRERDDYLEKNVAPLDYTKPEEDVVVTLVEHKDGAGTLTVVDSGIGMTKETILNYFLTAGASYRNSPEWRNVHEDKDGTSQVQRTGRFGVGALAAFLLGSRIEVTTRHLKQPRRSGITFSCELGDKQIELRWTSCDVGTQVKIRVPPSTMKRILNSSGDMGSQWNWYVAAYPKVRRLVKIENPNTLFLAEEAKTTMLGRTLELPRVCTIPADLTGTLSEWRNLEGSHYENVFWNWGGFSHVCNGFKIGAVLSTGISSNIDDRLWRPSPEAPDAGTELRMPSLAFVDTGSKLPLNLARTQVLGIKSKSLLSPLTHEVCRDIIAFLLSQAPTSFATALDFSEQCLLSRFYDKLGDFSIPCHPAFSTRSKHLSLISVSTQGISLIEPKIIQDLKNSVYVFFIYPNRFYGYRTSKFSVKATDGVSFSFLNRNNMSTRTNVQPDLQMYKQILTDEISQTESNDLYEMRSRCLRPWSRFRTDGRAVLVPRSRLERLRSLIGEAEPLYTYDIDADSVILATGRHPKDWLPNDVFPTFDNTNSDIMIGFWNILPTSGNMPLSPLGRMWLELLQHPSISFDYLQRQSQFASAYKELANEIALWDRIGVYKRVKQ